MVRYVEGNNEMWVDAYEEPCKVIVKLCVSSVREALQSAVRSWPPSWGSSNHEYT